MKELLQTEPEKVACKQALRLRSYVKHIFEARAASKANLERVVVLALNPFCG